MSKFLTLLGRGSAGAECGAGVVHGCWSRLGSMVRCGSPRGGSQIVGGAGC